MHNAEVSTPVKCKPFPWKCGHCRERAVRPAPMHYTVNAFHDGRHYLIDIPDLITPQCENCGEGVITREASERITDALRRQLNILAPEQIRTNRETLGFSRKDLADRLAVTVSTLEGWEDGTQLQQQLQDRLLRLFFAFANVRNALGDKHFLSCPSCSATHETATVEASIV